MKKKSISTLSLIAFCLLHFIGCSSDEPFVEQVDAATKNLRISNKVELEDALVIASNLKSELYSKHDTRSSVTFKVDYVTSHAKTKDLE